MCACACGYCKQSYCNFSGSNFASRTQGFSILFLGVSCSQNDFGRCWVRQSLPRFCISIRSRPLLSSLISHDQDFHLNICTPMSFSIFTHCLQSWRPATVIEQSSRSDVGDHSSLLHGPYTTLSTTSLCLHKSKYNYRPTPPSEKIKKQHPVQLVRDTTDERPASASFAAGLSHNLRSTPVSNAETGLGTFDIGTGLQPLWVTSRFCGFYPD